jgi:hypothetical protein
VKNRAPQWCLFCQSGGALATKLVVLSVWRIARDAMKSHLRSPGARSCPFSRKPDV